MKNVLFILIAFVIPHIALAQQRIYVQASATGANNGQSWANAFTDLKTALQTSHPGDTLWVAQGIYRPTLTNDRNISFEPKSGTVLYGGFAGTETQLSQRDWQKYPTVLSGDIGLPGDSLDNSRCVVYLHEPDSNTVLDGFTIRHGFADLTSIGSFERGRSGGGLYIMGAEAEAYPTIRNCRFEHNSSRTFGGGAMVNGSNDGSVGPLFQHCTFWNNQALNGGGMARQGASWIKRGVCWDSCIFLSNHAINRGGGIYYFDTDGQDSTRIDGCQFIKNTAGVAGGGTFLYIGRNNGPLHCTVSRSLFSMNEAGEGAAVDFFTNFGSFEGSIQVCWSVFDNNTSQGGGTSNSVVYTDMIAKLTSSSVLLNENLFQNHTVASSVALVGCAEGRFLGSKNSFIKNSSVCFWYGSCFKAFLSDNVYQENDSVSCCVDNGNTLPNGIISYQNCIFMKNKFTFQGRYIKVSGWKVSVEIKNCNFYGGTKLYCLVAGSSDSLPFLTYSNNSFHAIPNPIYFTEHLKTYISHSSFDTFDCSAQGPLITCGPGIVTGLDPLFVAPDSGNYRLQPCSPLVNAGSNAYVNSATDLAGQPRIQGGTVDIGAYETAPPTLSTAPTVTPACKGQPNGSVSLPAIGGCTPLTYAWASSGGQGGTGTGGLAPGLYTFTISDQRGSSTTLSLSVPDSSGIHISTLATPLLCGDTLGGSLLARALGGVPPLGFSWAGSTSTDSLRLGLAPGLYTVSVSDERGCTGSAVAEVKRQGHLASTVEVGRISCFGAADGSLTVLPLHGKAPWHWQWQGSSHDGPTLTPLGPGEYPLTLSDAFGCDIQWVLPLTQPDSLYISGAAISPASDSISADGSVSVMPAGGTAAYTGMWAGGQSGLSITNLPPATYTLTLTDAHGCSLTATYVVGVVSSTVSPAALVAVRVWPNPFEEVLRVSVDAELGLPAGAVLRLRDVQGREVAHWRLGGGEQAVQVPVLPAGVYGWEVVFSPEKDDVVARGWLVRE